MTAAEITAKLALFHPFCDECIYDLENHTDSRPKWESVYPFSRPKQRKNPTRWGGIYLYGLYKGVPPGNFVPSQSFS